jgi:hypothetical protein
VATAKYWLDADVFIQASRKWYKFERVPEFWGFIDKQLQAGAIRCPQAIFDDIVKGTDQLAQWVKSRKQNGLCVPLSDGVFAAYAVVANHIDASIHRQYQKDEFLSASDGWLIAYAMDSNATVVTQESSSRKRKIRIPTVCSDLKVGYTDTFKMLDDLGF